MAHTRPARFLRTGTRRISSRPGETLHLKAEYINVDFPSFEIFPLHSHGGPYIEQVHLARRFGASNLVKTPFFVTNPAAHSAQPELSMVTVRTVKLPTMPFRLYLGMAHMLCKAMS